MITQGKWIVTKSGGRVELQTMGHPKTICTLVETAPLKISPEVEANARLIAASPQMLEELKHLIFLEKTAMTKKQVKMAISRAKDLLAEIA